MRSSSVGLGRPALRCAMPMAASAVFTTLRGRCKCLEMFSMKLATLATDAGSGEMSRCLE